MSFYPPLEGSIWPDALRIVLSAIRATGSRRGSKMTRRPGLETADICDLTRNATAMPAALALYSTKV